LLLARRQAPHSKSEPAIGQHGGLVLWDPEYYLLTAVLTLKKTLLTATAVSVEGSKHTPVAATAC